MSDRSTRALDAPPTPAEQDDAVPPEPIAGADPAPEAAPEAKASDPETSRRAQDSVRSTAGEPPDLAAVETPDPAAGETPDPAGEAASATTHPPAAPVEVEVECPGCGLILVGDQPRPTAEWFCPRCDYPVFWASPPADDGGDKQRRARRRLPGASGRQALGADPCWHCGEMNDRDATACLRCAATLPKPTPPEPERVTVTVEVERPMPVAYVARTATWPFVAAAALGGMAIAITGTLWALHAAGRAVVLGHALGPVFGPALGGG